MALREPENDKSEVAEMLGLPVAVDDREPQCVLDIVVTTVKLLCKDPVPRGGERELLAVHEI